MNRSTISSVTPAQAESSRQAWDRIAPGYDRTNTPTQMWLAAEGLKRVGPRAGMSFLDVAAGSGALAIPAARLGASVTAVDQSPVMLELLAKRAEAEGLQIECHVMDGHALGFTAGSFDAVGSQFGVMLFPDMPTGIRAMARVTKPGGRVLVIAYGDPHEIDFLTLFVHAVRTVRPEFSGPSPDPPPLPFQLQGPRSLHAELRSAGLRNVKVETIRESTRFAGGAAFWDWIISSNPIVPELLEELRLSATEREALVRALEGLVQERANGEGVTTLSNPVNIGVGVRVG